MIKRHILAAMICTAWVFPAHSAPTRQIKATNTVINNAKLTGYRIIDATDLATGLKVTNSTFTSSRASIRIGGDAHDIVFRDVSIVSTAVNKGSDLPAGIDLRDTVHDVLLDRVTSANHRMVYVPGNYTNGDGFSNERGTYRITYRQTRSTGNSDGGYDLKSTDTELDDVTAENNGRNYRIWGSAHATKITSIDPTGAHVWGRTGNNLLIDMFVARSTTTAPMFYLEPGGKVTVTACDFQVAPNTPMFSKATRKADVTLGTGCLMDANGFVINTPVAPPVPPVAQVKTITLAALYVDKGGDGFIALSNATADREKLPRGTVLKAAGGVAGAWVYVVVK